QRTAATTTYTRSLPDALPISVRMEQHARNALAICQWLAQQPVVQQIFHPAWPQDAGHDLWKRDCTGSNGLMSVALALSADQVRTFVNALTLFGIGYSWGGYESLVQWVDTAALRNHAYFGDAANSGAQVVRLHIGLESVDDLIADLQQALGKAGVV